MWSDMIKAVAAGLEHAKEELHQAGIPEAVASATGEFRVGLKTAVSKTRETVTSVILPLTHSTLSLMREEASQIAAHTDLKSVLSYLNKVWMYTSKNPRVVYSATGFIVIIWPGLVYKSVLWVLGFGWPGVSGGSHAAKAHSGIGNIRRGSPFATGQSAGAGGRGTRVFAHLVRSAFLVGAVWWALVVVAGQAYLEST